MNTYENERMEDPCEYMAQLAQKYLPLNHWGFKESFRSNKDERLIFDSQWCRMKFSWSGWEMYGGNTISTFYGRLHAPRDDVRMKWNEKVCHCWHREELILHFLDQRKAEYAAKAIFTHELIEQYKLSDLGQGLAGKRRQPEWLVQMHATIWKNYAPRLFEVFDLRRPDLWEQYQSFVKQVYDIKGRNPAIVPPPDQIC